MTGRRSGCGWDALPLAWSGFCAPNSRKVGGQRKVRFSSGMNTCEGGGEGREGGQVRECQGRGLWGVGWGGGGGLKRGPGVCNEGFG